MILSNISTPLLGLVDTAVLGHLDSERYLAAVALGGLIFSFIFWGFGFLRMGTTGLTAQAIGQNNRLEVNAVVLRALSLALIIAAFVLLLQNWIEQFGFWLIEGNPQVEGFARQYFAIRIWSTPATLSLYVLLGWFLGQQRVKIPLLVVLITNLTNIGLDVLFVYHFNMQVAGVALASLIAEYTGLIVALLIAGRALIREKTRRSWRDIFCLSKFKAMLVFDL